MLDAIARRALEHLELVGDGGLTVRELAAAIGANISTTGNVLRGQSATFGPDPFVRTGRQGQSLLWRARDNGGAL